MSTYTIVPDWHEHKVCLCAWPVPESGWEPHYLDELYREILFFFEQVIERGFQRLKVVVPDKETAHFLRKRFGTHIDLYIKPYKDVWLRDIGPINVVSSETDLGLLKPRFNAWGAKYDFDKDNDLASQLFNNLIELPMIFEGGALESNGEILFINESCFDKARGYPSDEAFRRILSQIFKEDLLVLSLPPFDGDDTDGHIDTMLRFVDKNTIVVDKRVSRHPYFDQICQRALALNDRLKFHVLDSPIYGHLPATYVNFYYAAPDCILMPSYGLSSDMKAKTQLEDVVSSSTEVILVPAQFLVKQYGSWHCYALNITKEEFFNA